MRSIYETASPQRFFNRDIGMFARQDPELEHMMMLNPEAPLDDHLNLYPLRETVVSALERVASDNGTVHLYVMGPTGTGKEATITHIIHLLTHESSSETPQDKALRRRLQELEKKTGKPLVIEHYSTSTGYNRAMVKGDITSPIGYFQPHEVNATNNSIIERKKECGAENPGRKLEINEFPIVGFPDNPFGVPPLLSDLALMRQEPNKHIVLGLFINPTVELQERSLLMREHIAQAPTPQEAQQAAQGNLMKMDRPIDPESDSKSWGGKKAAANNDQVAYRDAFENQDEIRKTVDPNLPQFKIEDLEKDSEVREVVLTARSRWLGRKLGFPDNNLFIRYNAKLPGYQIPFYREGIIEKSAVWDIKNKRPKQGWTFSFQDAA